MNSKSFAPSVKQRAGDNFGSPSGSRVKKFLIGFLVVLVGVNLLVVIIAKLFNGLSN
jgi:hypothetical protein